MKPTLTRNIRVEIRNRMYPDPSKATEEITRYVERLLITQREQITKEKEELEIEKKNILEVIESIRRVTNSMYEVGEHLFLRTSEIKSKIRKHELSGVGE